MNKRILFITSLYSGLRESIIKNNWNPKGMPAIYKLLEGLKEREINFDCYFLSSNDEGVKDYPVSYFKGNSFKVIGYYPNDNLLKKVFPKYIFKYIFTTNKLKQIDFSQYGLVYFDRGSVEYRYLLNLIKLPPTVLRLHGVSQLYQQYEYSAFKRTRSILKLLGFKSDYKLIISTYDGTPVDSFIKKYTASHPLKLKLLNGVDIFNMEYKDDQREEIRFLVVGRLEDDKGIMNIIDAFKDFGDSDRIKLTIIGGGSLEGVVKSKISTQNSISFIGEVDHNQIGNYYRNSDIFISCNLLGNLSNVVLEAINYGLGIITLKKDTINSFDLETYEFIEENALYVDRNNVKIELSSLLNEIAFNKELVSELKAKSRKNLKPKLISWKNRINQEINLLEKISG